MTSENKIKINIEQNVGPRRYTFFLGLETRKISANSTGTEFRNVFTFL